MISYLSNYFANLLLQQHLVANGGWLGLHETDPTTLGLLSGEVAGAGYLRQRVLFFDASNKTVASSNAQKFVGMPACLVTWLAVWDAAATGHMLFRIPLATPIPVQLNGHLLAAAGDVALTL